MSDIRCPNHPTADLIEDHRAGDVICPECGLVVGDRVVDVGTEWRSFNNEKSCSDPSRVGAPENQLLSGSDLSTSIVYAAGSDDSGLAMIQRKTMNSSDRQLTQAFAVIREMADRIHMSKSIQDQANKLFKDVLETKQLKGRNHEAIAAACLYIACRKEGVPRTFKEVCAISRVSKKEIGRCFRLILKALETNLDAVTSADFMSRFCSNLTLSAEETRRLQSAAQYIAKQAASNVNVVAGRSPISVAAASIFLASNALNLKKTAREIGEIAGAAESTIKQTYRLLLPRADELFPPDFKFMVPIERLMAENDRYGRKYYKAYDKVNSHQLQSKSTSQVEYCVGNCSDTDKLVIDL